MMAQERDADWDWVKATGLCKAEVMFGRLREIAKRNVDERNKQLTGSPFELRDIDGVTFSVSKRGDLTAAVFFGLTPDLKSIVVSGLNRVNEVTYTVALDANGSCKFRRDQDELDFWQVLKAALERLFF